MIQWKTGEIRRQRDGKLLQSALMEGRGEKEGDRDATTAAIKQTNKQPITADVSECSRSFLSHGPIETPGLRLFPLLL